MPFVTSGTLREYDVIVVGSGAAGGQTAYTLAKKGLIGIQGDHAGTLTLRGVRIRAVRRKFLRHRIGAGAFAALCVFRTTPRRWRQSLAIAAIVRRSSAQPTS